MGFAARLAAGPLDNDELLHERPIAASNSLLNFGCSGVVIGKVVRCPLAIPVGLKIACLLLGVHFEF